MPSDLFERLAHTGRELRDGLLHLFLPASCYVCGVPLAASTRHFCDACRTSVFVDPHSVCPRCAATIGPFGSPDGRCPNCREESFAFERVLRLGLYADKLRELVLRLKFHGNEGLAELVGELWAHHARSEFDALQVDAIVPVPLHWWRRWRRGYNQSAALAHGLASILGLPLETAWVRRIRNTPMQTSMTIAGRRENVRGAFVVRRGAPVRDRSILLVDDVLTTGATASETARMLHRAGAKQVVVAVLARANS